MNLKIYFVLLSAFFTSTLVYEIRAFWILANPGACENDNNSNNIYVNASLSVVANANENLFAIANTTGEDALVIDIGNNIIALLNGNSGAAIIVNLNNNDGIYLNCGVWLASEQTIEELLSSLTSLESLLKSSEGESFKYGKASEEIYSEVNTVVNGLIFKVESTLKWEPEVGLQLVIVISKDLVQLLDGDLRGFVQLFGSQPIDVIGDLPGILNFLKGFATVFVKIGGLEYALSKGVVVDLNEIASLPDGVEVLDYLLRVITTKIDADCLASILNDPASLFELFAKLGNNVKTGVNGIYRVLKTITSYIDGKSALEDVVTTAIEFLSFSAEVNNEYLSCEFNNSLKELKSAIDTFNPYTDLSEELSDFIETINGLISGELEIKGIDIAKIIEILIDGVSQDSSSTINVLVKVLLQLQPVVDVKTSLSTSLFVLILNVNSAYGVQMLRLLEIDINININLHGTSIIASLLEEVSNVNEISQKNVYEALCDIPVLKTLVKAFQSSVSGCGEEITISDLLSSDNDITPLILGLFQTCGDVRLGVSERTIVEVKSYLNSCTSLTVYLGIKADVTIGVVV